MKKLTVLAAGFGASLLKRHNVRRIAGLDFDAAPGVFPAVTCVAQASMRTGLSPLEHGMISNGAWIDLLRKPLFWEQSAELVKGPRIWDDRRAAGAKVGMAFFQQSLGERVDAILSPAPIHKHGGGMIMSVYAKPTELSVELEKKCGKFPLWRYWGPLASPKVGRKCIEWFEGMCALSPLDEAYLYLPTLDYAAQKYGPDTAAGDAAFAEFVRQLESLADWCSREGWELKVAGDYEIVPVTAAPLRPNVLLRRQGFFRVREVGGMAYPDFYQSTAFAMCDHEFCVICGERREEAAERLVATGEYEEATLAKGAAPILLARRGSWCEYKWWTSRREAPDFASHVDIHNKPGYDPTELFFFGRGTVRGTHGRRRAVAVSSS